MLLKRKGSGFGIREVKEQKAGFRIQESGVRMQAICSPPAAYCTWGAREWRRHPALRDR
jgi:hypothetical protein